MQARDIAFTRRSAIRRPVRSSAPTISPSPSAACPRISFGSGDDLLDGGKAAGEADGKDYNKNRYHQPADEWRAEWSFTGMARDLGILQAFGAELANSTRWPNWAEDSEFRAARDATAADRR